MYMYVNFAKKKNLVNLQYFYTLLYNISQKYAEILVTNGNSKIFVITSHSSLPSSFSDLREKPRLI